MVWSWLYYGFLYFINVHLWFNNCGNIFFVISTYKFFLKTFSPTYPTDCLTCLLFFILWLSVYYLHSWEISLHFSLWQDYGKSLLSTFIEGRTPTHIETKIISGEEHSGLSCFELDVLAASHFILSPNLMYIKCIYNRNGRLIKREWVSLNYRDRNFSVRVLENISRIFQHV